MPKFFLELSRDPQFGPSQYELYELAAKTAPAAVREAMDAAPMYVDLFAGEYAYWYESDPDAEVYGRVVDADENDLGARWTLRVAPPGNNSDDFSE